MFQQTSDQMTKQFDQAVNFANLYQDQVQKVTTFWMDQTMAAIKEGQKFTQEWMNASKKMTDDFLKVLETSTKETARMFSPEA